MEFMKVTKLLLLSVAMAFKSMGGMAVEPGVTFLLTNGQKISFAFTSKPEITVGVQELTVSSSEDETVSVSYAFDEVQRFYFEDDVDDYVTGIQDTEDESSARPIFRYANGVINVSGLKTGECIIVASVNGSAVGSAKADQSGNASVDISNAVNGVYVVNAGSGVSFKLLKK